LTDSDYYVLLLLLLSLQLLWSHATPHRLNVCFWYNWCLLRLLLLRY